MLNTVFFANKNIKKQIATRLICFLLFKFSTFSNNFQKSCSISKYLRGSHDLVQFLQFKKVKNTHEGILLLVKLQNLACNFTKSSTPPWMVFTFLKLYKWHQITQSVSNIWNFKRK